MRVGLAQATFPTSLQNGVEKVIAFLKQAREQQCDIICLPESYLPGLRGVEFEIAPHDQSRQEQALEAVRQAAAEYGVALVIGMDWESERGLQNVVFVISETGEVLGKQTKNQIPLEEEASFVHGDVRRLFTVKGVPFGIAICHEGWRYPETVRFAAMRGAQIVFHPHYSGGMTEGQTPRFWGDPEAPFYEKAMMCRSLENTIYFASVNYAMDRQESATSLISPAGECVGHVPYGEEGLLVHDLDLSAATGLLAKRYAPVRYAEE